MMLSAPARADGPQSITIPDPVSGASSVMTNALIYGAAPGDNIVLLGSGLNPPTPVGYRQLANKTVSPTQIS